MTICLLLIFIGNSKRRILGRDSDPRLTRYADCPDSRTQKHRRKPAENPSGPLDARLVSRILNQIGCLYE